MNSHRAGIVCASLLVLGLATGDARAADEAMVEKTYDLRPALKALGPARPRPPLKSAKDIVRDGTGIPAEQALEMIERTVLQVITPTEWKSVTNGEATAKRTRQKLTVKHTPRRQEEIRVLLERMAKPARLAGGKALVSVEPEVLATVMVIDISGVRADLAGGGAYPVEDHEWAERLAKRIRTAVPEETWKESGGRDGSLLILGPLLIIEQTPENLMAIGGALQQWASGK